MTTPYRRRLLDPDTEAGVRALVESLDLGGGGGGVTAPVTPAAINSFSYEGELLVAEHLWLDQAAAPLPDGLQLQAFVWDPVALQNYHNQSQLRAHQDPDDPDQGPDITGTAAVVGGVLTTVAAVDYVGNTPSALHVTTPIDSGDIPAVFPAVAEAFGVGQITAVFEGGASTLRGSDELSSNSVTIAVPDPVIQDGDPEDGRILYYFLAVNVSDDGRTGWVFVMSYQNGQPTDYSSFGVHVIDGVIDINSVTGLFFAAIAPFNVFTLAATADRVLANTGNYGALGEASITDTGNRCLMALADQADILTATFTGGSDEVYTPGHISDTIPGAHATFTGPGIQLVDRNNVNAGCSLVVVARNQAGDVSDPSEPSEVPAAPTAPVTPATGDLAVASNSTGTPTEVASAAAAAIDGCTVTLEPGDGPVWLEGVASFALAAAGTGSVSFSLVDTTHGTFLETAFIPFPDTQFPFTGRVDTRLDAVSETTVVALVVGNNPEGGSSAGLTVSNTNPSPSRIRAVSA